MTLADTIPFTDFARDVLHFNLTTGQRVVSRVAFDGIDPIDLNTAEEIEIAREIFGPVDRIPKSAGKRLVLRCGRRGGKTRLVAAYSIYRLCTGPIEHVSHDDPPAVVVISTRLAASALGGGGSSQEMAAAALGFAHRDPYIAKMVRTPSRQGFAMSRPDGWLVRFLCAPRAKGGGSFRSLSLLEAILDESEFIAPNDPGAAVRDSDLITAASPALMSHGRVTMASTPWPAPSETASLFDANWGKPTHALCARATTLRMRDYRPDLVETYDAEMARDPLATAREWDCEIVDGGGTFFEASSIDLAVAEADSATIATGENPSAGIDLGFRTNSSTLVVVERRHVTTDDGAEEAPGDRSRVVVVHVDEQIPTKGKPLVPSKVLRGFAASASALGVDMLCADGHYIETTREHAQELALGILEGPRGNEAFVKLRELFRERRIVLPQNKRLVDQLKSVRATPKSGGGLAITLPLVGGAHCDIVSALVLAVFASQAPAGPVEPSPRPGSAEHVEAWWRRQGERVEAERRGEEWVGDED